MTTIRCARTYDAPALAELCGELGYPATRQQIVTRLAAIEASPTTKLFVAEEDGGRLIGWLQVEATAHLVTDDVAEILGLVVTANARNAGAGVKLVSAAETWAKSRGMLQVRVRSRVERERAHRFYEREGYTYNKTQVVFLKNLA